MAEDVDDIQNYRSFSFGFWSKMTDLHTLKENEKYVISTFSNDKIFEANFEIFLNNTGYVSIIHDGSVHVRREALLVFHACILLESRTYSILWVQCLFCHQLFIFRAKSAEDSTR